MNEIIKRDIEAYAKEYRLLEKRETRNEKWGTFFCIGVWWYLMLHNRSFRSLYYYRKGKWAKLYSWLLPGEPTLHLPRTCKIGAGTLFFHSYGTILNAWSVGENCRITCNITLGDKAGKRPVIGNRVEILPGAVIAGDVTIGDDCVIGPNCVVHKSVHANCVVVGNPAMILKKNGVVVREML